MSKVIFVGDPHLDSRTPVSRLDDYRVLTLEKLKNLYLLAVDQNVDHVVMTGDMFHRYDVPISYLNEVMFALKMFKHAGIDVWSIIGNHDIPHNVMDYFKNTPLSLLFQSGLLKQLGDSGNALQLANTRIRGLSFTEDVDDLEKIRPGEQYELLVMHYAIDNTVANESIPFEKLEPFDVVVCGHDHMYYPPLLKDNGTRYYRPGSFTRRTKDDYNLTRDIVVYMFEDSSYQITELKLPGMVDANLVFKNEVFHTNVENFYKNNYADVFRGLSSNREYANIFEIIDDLPPDVYTKSIKALEDFLVSEGITRKEPELINSEEEDIDYIDAFSQ
jgi:predicted phosphodiesterase